MVRVIREDVPVFEKSKSIETVCQRVLNSFVNFTGCEPVCGLINIPITLASTIPTPTLSLVALNCLK